MKHVTTRQSANTVTMCEVLHAYGASFIHTLKDDGCDGFSRPTSTINNHTIVNNYAIIRVRNDTGCPRGLRFGKYRWYVVGNISGFAPALPDLAAEGDGLNHPFQG